MHKYKIMATENGYAVLDADNNLLHEFTGLNAFVDAFNYIRFLEKAEPSEKAK